MASGRAVRRWSARADGCHIEIEWRDGELYLEDGPSDWPRRGHEGHGGTFSIEEVRRRGPAFFEEYPGLHDELMADLETRYRVVDAPSAVLATVTSDLHPHAVPCCFATEGRRLFTPIDQVKPKRTTSPRRRANLAHMPPAIANGIRAAGHLQR